MKLSDLFGSKRNTRFPYDNSMSEEELVDMLNDMRAELMFEDDPSLRKELKQQMAELTKLVASKTKRPRRDVWSDEERQLRNR